jgi:hypothetical protein
MELEDGGVVEEQRTGVAMVGRWVRLCYLFFEL